MGTSEAEGEKLKFHKKIFKNFTLHYISDLQILRPLKPVGLDHQNWCASSGLKIIFVKDGDILEVYPGESRRHSPGILARFPLCLHNIKSALAMLCNDI